MTGITDKWDEPPLGSTERVQAEIDAHQRFTVSSTAYMRNQTRDHLYHNRWIAVHYQDTPTHGSLPGSKSMGMRFPFLILADYVEKPEEVGEKVARILNAHWDNESEYNQTTSIQDLGLPARARNALLSMGLATISEVDSASDSTLLRLPNFGRKSLKHVRDAINAGRRRRDG